MPKCQRQIKFSPLKGCALSLFKTELINEHKIFANKQDEKRL